MLARTSNTPTPLPLRMLILLDTHIHRAHSHTHHTRTDRGRWSNSLPVFPGLDARVRAVADKGWPSGGMPMLTTAETVSLLIYIYIHTHTRDGARQFL
jgi:hypothetical protein